MASPTVFISYSHDSPEHTDRVLELSNQLRADGIDCTIDQYEVSPAEGWPKWMDRQITKSDFVLVICTEIYHRRVMGEEEIGKGLGVKWESTISYQSIYDADSANTRFIPIFFEGGKTEFIPQPIKGATYYLLPQQYDELYRRLTNQPKVKKPELGSIKKLEALEERERKTDFFEGTTTVWYLAHPYPMPPNFTGRVAEQKMLDDWLAYDQDRLLVLRALGGFGKSALVWRWINTRVNPAEWTKLVWWSFYEGDASFEHFIEETLKYLNLEVPQGQRPQVDKLLKAMQSQKILLIMDGFERAMRAYSGMNAAYQGDEEAKKEDNARDCVNINAELFLKNICSLPGIRGKILMTTRLTPRAIEPRGQFLQGCNEVELKTMHKDDAVKFFRAQRIKGSHAEIESACEPYGYHPLSLRILAGLIVDDREKPGDIEVAKKLDITNNIIANKNHVLNVAYYSLKPEQQKLLSTIACFRAPMTYEVLKSISSKPSGKGKKTKVDPLSKLDDGLSVLGKRGLLHWDRKNNKYDLHPIVRRYAYERLTATDRTAAHTRLRDYFAAVDVPAKPQTFDDLAPVIELYHHTVRAGELDKAFELFNYRLTDPLYFQMGAYQTIIELLGALFLKEEDKLPSLKTEDFKAHALNLLALAHSLSGQPRRAVGLFDTLNKILEKNKDKANLAIGLGNIATYAQFFIGSLRAAESNIRRYIQISVELDIEAENADAYRELGRFMTYFAKWDAAESEYKKAENFFNKTKNLQGGGQVWLYRALRALLMVRDPLQSIPENRRSAIEFAKRALDLAEATAREHFPVPRDFVRAHWILGAAYRLNGQLNVADHHLAEALTRDRTMDLVEIEADILLDIARLRYDQKNYEEAKSLAEEALTITERGSYILQGADVNLFLAQYALEQEQDKAKAKEYAETALKLATCDGPPYYYKVAYEEAVEMLKRLKV